MTTVRKLFISHSLTNHAAYHQKKTRVIAVGCLEAVGYRGVGERDALGAGFAGGEDLPDLLQLPERVAYADPLLSGLISDKRAVHVEVRADDAGRACIAAAEKPGTDWNASSDKAAATGIPNQLPEGSG